jgi:uncharacterized membrane protein
MLVLKILLAAVMILAGVMHFASRRYYERIVPKALPWPGLIVALSGISEIALGIALLVPQTSRSAAWGLIALYLAVFPANVSQALRKIPFGRLPLWTTWARLPLQAGFIAWAYAFT